MVRPSLVLRWTGLIRLALQLATASQVSKIQGSPSGAHLPVCRYAYLMLAVELLGAAAVLLGGLVIMRRAPRLPATRKERWRADPEDAGSGWSTQVSPVPCQ